MYSLKYGTFTFDDHYNIEGLDLTGLPIRTSSQLITGRDGSIIWKQLYDSRTLTISGSIIADTALEYESAWRSLVNAFAIGDESSKALEVTLSSGEIRYIDCKTISLPSINESVGNVYTGSFLVVLQAESPYYRDDFSTETLTIASASGFPVATTVPTPLGGISTNTVNINITGEYGSYPTYMINPSVTNPRITNQTTGESFQIEMEVNGATGPVPVSFDQSGIHVGDNNEYNQYFVGTYFRLVNGNNNIVFTGADASGATLELTYSNEYISV